MPRAKNNKPAAPLPWDGLLKADVYDLEVPVFLCTNKQKAFISSQGIPIHGYPTHPVRGLACCDRHPQGFKIWTVYINPELASAATWAHELSHIVDMVFDHLSMSTGYEVTEPRAYLLSHLFEQIEEIMWAHYEREKRRNKAAQRRKTLKKGNSNDQ